MSLTESEPRGIHPSPSFPDLPGYGLNGKDQILDRRVAIAQTKMFVRTVRHNLKNLRQLNILDMNADNRDRDQKAIRTHLNRFASRWLEEVGVQIFPSIDELRIGPCLIHHSSWEQNTNHYRVGFPHIAAWVRYMENGKK